MNISEALRRDVHDERTTVESFSTIKVLMVEDDDHYFNKVRQLISYCLQPRFSLSHARSLEEACHLLSWRTPDVILLDLKLPDSDGLSTLATIQKHSFAAPIVVLTGSDDEAIGLQSVVEGAQDYLVKQRISNESLIRGLQYAVQRHKAEEARLRLAAIEDFTATLNHDLRTPMIGANTLFDALLNGDAGNLDEQQKEILYTLRSANLGQLKLVQTLLDIYRFEARESLALQPIELQDLLSDCVSSLESNDGEQAAVTIDVPSNLSAIIGDEKALTLLFKNLLDNARKFGTSGKPITIFAETFEELVAVHVHNFGQGIPAEVQSYLFQNFWHGVPGKRYVARTGLGLYLCQRVAWMHGGRIRCSSSDEGGTTFSVILPIRRS